MHDRGRERQGDEKEKTRDREMIRTGRETGRGGG